MSNQILAIFAVMALLSGSLWWLRRHGMARFASGFAIRRPRRNLEVLERLPLAPHHSLHLVRHGSRSLLIGISPSGCSLLESRENQASASAAGERA